MWHESLLGASRVPTPTPAAKPHAASPLGASSAAAAASGGAERKELLTVYVDQIGGGGRGHGSRGGADADWLGPAPDGGGGSGPRADGGSGQASGPANGQAVPPKWAWCLFCMGPIDKAGGGPLPSPVIPHISLTPPPAAAAAPQAQRSHSRTSSGSHSRSNSGGGFAGLPPAIVAASQ